MGSYITGVAGWLGLLIWYFMVLAPLSDYGRLSREFGGLVERHPALAEDASWLMYVQLSWALLAAFAAVGFAAGYRLWKVHRPESVRFAMVALWAIGPLYSLCGVAVLLQVFGIPLNQDAVVEIIVRLTVSSAWAGVLTVYLFRSARVRNTYGIT